MATDDIAPGVLSMVHPVIAQALQVKAREVYHAQLRTILFYHVGDSHNSLITCKLIPIILLRPFNPRNPRHPMLHIQFVSRCLLDDHSIIKGPSLDDDHVLQFLEMRFRVDRSPAFGAEQDAELETVVLMRRADALQFA